MLSWVCFSRETKLLNHHFLIKSLSHEKNLIALIALAYVPYINTVHRFHLYKPNTFSNHKKICLKKQFTIVMLGYSEKTPEMARCDGREFFLRH